MAGEGESTDWELLDHQVAWQIERDRDGESDTWEVIEPAALVYVHEDTPEKYATEYHDPPAVTVADGSCQRPQTAKASHQDKQESAEHHSGEDLKPCTSCNGYHYFTQCIYTLTWTEWLDYHLAFMASQSYGHSPEGLGEYTSDMQMLYYRAEELDETSESCEINYLCDTRLKADLMTKSSVEMYLDDEKWRRLLENDQGQATASSTPRDEGCSPKNNEDALITLEADFRKHLPSVSVLAEG